MNIFNTKFIVYTFLLLVLTLLISFPIATRVNAAWNCTCVPACNPLSSGMCTDITTTYNASGAQCGAYTIGCGGTPPCRREWSCSAAPF